MSVGVARNRAKDVNFGPSLLEIGPILVDSGRVGSNLAGFDPNLVKFGPKLVNSGHSLVKFGPKLADPMSTLVDVGLISRSHGSGADKTLNDSRPPDAKSEAPPLQKWAHTKHQTPVGRWTRT